MQSGAARRALPRPCSTDSRAHLSHCSLISRTPDRCQGANGKMGKSTSVTKDATQTPWRLKSYFCQAAECALAAKGATKTEAQVPSDFRPTFLRSPTPDLQVQTQTGPHRTARSFQISPHSSLHERKLRLNISQRLFSSSRTRVPEKPVSGRAWGQQVTRLHGAVSLARGRLLPAEMSPAPSASGLCLLRVLDIQLFGWLLLTPTHEEECILQHSSSLTGSPRGTSGRRM